MTAIIFSDYRLICGFMDHCRSDINLLKCGSIRPGEKKGLVKVAEDNEHRIKVSESCMKAILRVAELSSDDFHLDRHLYFACRDDREHFCETTQAGEGRVYKCLFNHKFEDAMSEKCRDALTTRQKLIAQDYKVSYSLAKSCKSDLKKYRCNVENLPRTREARLSYLLMCLESAVHRGRQVSSECQGEMLDYRRMLMEDFSLSPEIILGCRTEIEHHCSGLHRKGRTLHCLMKVVRGEKGNLGDSCQHSLQSLIQEVDPVADYRIDRALNEACESVIQTACKHIRSGDPMILSCLMEHLYTEKMVEDCEHRLLELQYFISRDWKLDFVLYRKCQGDASRLCHTHGWNETSEMIPPGAVFSCLYRHAYRTEEQGRRLSRECRAEVQRILHQRALDVKLDPSLQDKCMIDLGKWCSEKTETGQELECLQDHLDDLVTDCREVVGNLTELESEDIQIEALLMRACEPIIQTFCHCYFLEPLYLANVLLLRIVSSLHRQMASNILEMGIPEIAVASYLQGEMADNQIDSGDLMECLVQNKHQKEMNEKCAVGVTHFQLIQMKDFRFSYKFKMACKEDVLKLCPNIKKKVDVVICLSTTVRNDTLQDAKEHRVSVKCRKQLRVEELEMTEDIRLEPDLHEACKTDIRNYCQNVPYGNAQRFCPEADAKNMLQCLKQNKNSEVMDPKCKQMITKRQITQNTDYRLNPRLSSDCEDQIRVIIEESALDYRLDPQLQLHCSEEIFNLCAEEAAAQEQTGQVEECLKVNLLKIKAEMCKKEVLNMLKESKADIFVDPVLHTACALDIKHHCAAITPGRGRQMSCLMEALEDKRVRLQPECKKRLNDRIEMWSFAAKVAPAEGFSDLAMQVVTSPSKNYILSVISAGICVLFLIGLMCGRITKRVTRELKDR
ncbi:hypothetical protein E2320_001004 [Naja naja]|nr:hypothetical protein E2320_001004 [Naja naja]